MILSVKSFQQSTWNGILSGMLLSVFNVNAATLATDQDISLGADLYANHCGGCHESRLHIRQHRKARSLQGIETYVRRWQKAQDLNWDKQQVRAVTQYLNLRYYKY
jgi:hypothetical protein